MIHNEEIEFSFLHGLKLAIIASLIGWFTYLVYQIVYHPKNVYKLIPRRLKGWSLLQKLGVTDKSATFKELHDRFNSLEQVTKEMRSNGLEQATLIVGIDFTASNEWQGRKSFGGRSLHHISIDPKSGKVIKWNPYQKVMRTIGETLEEFDEDQRIYAYGFGDEKTKDKAVFPLLNDKSPCASVNEVLSRYNKTACCVALSGPTSFAPIIKKAVEIVGETGKYHVLLIVADGRVEGDQDTETRTAMVEASSYPLSIVVVGVGDGPWETMHVYDNQLPQRRFDNFQFVEFMGTKKRFFRFEHDTEFALHALMEIPDQYRAIKQLGLLGNGEDDSAADYNQNATRDFEKPTKTDVKTGKRKRCKTTNILKQTDV